MAIWIDEESKILIQGITGKQGTFHGTRMVRYKTNVVGGAVSYTHLTLPTNREV